MKANKKTKRAIIILVILIVIATIILLLSLRLCTNEKYTIIFKDSDGTVLNVQEVNKYGLPVFYGKLERKPNKIYKYKFLSWDKKIKKATHDETYTAVYSSYLIDEKIIGSSKTPKSVSERIKCTTALATNDYENTSKSENSFEIIFIDDDGTVLQKSFYNIGEMPFFKGKNPHKETSDLIYNFKEWSPSIHAVAGNQTYRATYNIAQTNTDDTELPVSMVTVIYMGVSGNYETIEVPVGTNLKIRLTDGTSAYDPGGYWGSNNYTWFQHALTDPNFPSDIITEHDEVAVWWPMQVRHNEDGWYAYNNAQEDNFVVNEDLDLTNPKYKPLINLELDGSMVYGATDFSIKPLMAFAGYEYDSNTHTLSAVYNVVRTWSEFGVGAALYADEVVEIW